MMEQDEPVCPSRNARQGRLSSTLSNSTSNIGVIVMALVVEPILTVLFLCSIMPCHELEALSYGGIVLDMHQFSGVLATITL